MSRMLILGLTWLVGVATRGSLGAQLGASDGQWRSYGGDQGHTKYSPLDQITKDNVHDLRIAWTWTSVDENLKERNEVIRENSSFRTYPPTRSRHSWSAGSCTRQRHSGKSRPSTRRRARRSGATLP